MARPARARAVGEVLEMRALVEASSDWSSVARRESWVVAKRGTSTGFRGGMFGVRLTWLEGWWRA